MVSSTGVNIKSPSCTMSVVEGKTSIESRGHFDDGSDDRIVFKKFATKAVLHGIDKIRAINTAKIKVVLRNDTNYESFAFSLSWHVPRAALHFGGRMFRPRENFVPTRRRRVGM